MEVRTLEVSFKIFPQISQFHFGSPRLAVSLNCTWINADLSNLSIITLIMIAIIESPTLSLSIKIYLGSDNAPERDVKVIRG